MGAVRGPLLGATLSNLLRNLLGVTFRLQHVRVRARGDVRAVLGSTLVTL